MRVGDLTRLSVPGTDLEMVVRLRWGEYKMLVREIASRSELEALPAIDAFLSRALVELHGLKDASGAPLDAGPEQLDDLSPATIMAMFQALLQIGEGAVGDPLPAETVDAEAFAQPPGR